MPIPGTIRYTAQADIDVAHQRVIEAIDSVTDAFGRNSDIVGLLLDAAIALNKAKNRARDV